MKKIALVCLLSVAGCSPFMEANRPEPVDMKQFNVGESRLSVLSAIGSPLATDKDGDNSCDVYKLYTEGHSSTGKGVIAASEAVADVFTLGLAEVVFTPAEAATQDDKHAVLFCYTPDNKLASYRVSDAKAE